MTKRATKPAVPKWFLGLITTIVTVTITLILLESGFRIVNFQPKGRAAVPNEFQISEIPGIPYELTPNHSYKWKYGARKLFDNGFEIPVSINSLGYRDSELRIPKPPNEYRILAIGDSFTWGLGVRQEETWVEQLENLLNTYQSRINIAGGKNPNQQLTFEVINSGVGSWNTEAEYHFLQHKGMNVEPDAIIIGFLSNDFRTNNTDYTIDQDGFLVSKVKKDSSRLHLQSLVFDDSKKRSWFKRMVESSHLIRWASGRKIRTEKQALHVFNDRNSKERTRKALEGMFEIARNTKIPMYVCIFPYIESPIPESELNDLKEVATWCHASNIQYLYMGEALAEMEVADLWVHPKDHHPNAKAHEKYAHYIVNSLFIGSDRSLSSTFKR